MINPIYERTVETLYTMINELETEFKIETFEEIEGNYFILNQRTVLIADYFEKKFVKLEEQDIPENIKSMLKSN